MNQIRFGCQFELGAIRDDRKQDWKAALDKLKCDCFCSVRNDENSFIFNGKQRRSDFTIFYEIRVENTCVRTRKKTETEQSKADDQCDQMA